MAKKRKKAKAKAKPRTLAQRKAAARRRTKRTSKKGCSFRTEFFNYDGEMVTDHFTSREAAIRAAKKDSSMGDPYTGYAEVRVTGTCGGKRTKLLCYKGACH